MFFNYCLKDLPGKPIFRFRRFRDVNPLTQRTKWRYIGAPNEAMKKLQLRLMRYLRSLNTVMPMATAFRPNDSVLNNIRRHQGQRYFYLFDLEDAYQRVNIGRLATILCDLSTANGGHESEIYCFLRDYCQSPQGGLIIGANASPDLFNLYAGQLIDVPLKQLCQKYALTCTRYGDDLTLSSAKVPIGEKKRRAIRQVVGQAGFSAHHRKSFVYDLDKAPFVLNGIGLRKNGEIFLPRHYLRKINGLLTRAKHDRSLAPRIHGMMGLFKATVNDRPLNKKERKLLQRYRSFQERHRT